MKKTIIKIIKKLIVLLVILLLVILLLIKFVPGGKNVVNSGSILLFHNKVKHNFTDEEIDYLEKEIFGFEITDYGDITTGKLRMGRDGGILIEVDNIENAGEFKASIVGDSDSTPQSMHYNMEFMNGTEGEVEETIYYINDHRKHVYIYEQDNKVNVEILSEYIPYEVYNILDIPVIDN